MNPFKAPNIDHTCNSSPLNPCVCSDHEKYYAPVDNTQAAFDDYKVYLDSFSNVPQRHAVLFHGETGCGKTSLMNRCLKLYNEIIWKLNGETLIPYIVDVRSENLTAKSAEDKVSSILDYMYVTLGDEVIARNLQNEFGNQLGKNTNVSLKGSRKNNYRFWKRMHQF